MRSCARFCGRPRRRRCCARPGNPGIAADAQLFPVAVDDVPGLVALARDEEVGLVVVGPEAPLVAGVVDALTDAGIPVFGPGREAARLEGSKAFAKEVMEAAGVPTAAWTTVDDVAAGMAAIERYPVVLKFDGLAAGKGVVIARGRGAGAARRSRSSWRSAASGPGRVVVEEHLDGEEVSLLALCDGVRAIPMAPAQDYKRIFDGDEGPNTGGMGSYSPVPGVDAARALELSAVVHQPIVDELARRGTPFHGVLYAGIMLTADGPRVLEYNVRFGDPETQAVLPRLRSDLVELAAAAARPGGLSGARLDFDPRTAVTLVLASAGYPDAPRSGDPITGLGAVAPDVEITHAGTALAGDAARDRRRAGAERHRARRDAGRGPRGRLCCRRRDHVRRPAAPARHRPARRGAHDMTDQPQELTQTDPETAFDDLEVAAPRVGIIMGSKSDMPEMEKAGAVLEEAGIAFEIRVMSAHRDPDTVADYCRNARMRGLRVIIAGAGLSAALPGVAAAHSDLPVIGVPLSSRLSAAGGLDAILSVVQMPPGVPVAASGSTTRRTPATWRCGSSALDGRGSRVGA